MYTPLTLDKPRRLRFDIQACFDLEVATSQTLADTVYRLQRASIMATVYALWAGLKHEDDKLTVADVRRLLQAYLDVGGTMKTVTDALAEAFEQSAPLRESVPEGNAPRPATIAS